MPLLIYIVIIFDYDVHLFKQSHSGWFLAKPIIHSTLL